MRPALRMMFVKAAELEQEWSRQQSVIQPRDGRVQDPRARHNQPLGSRPPFYKEATERSNSPSPRARYIPSHVADQRRPDDGSHNHSSFVLSPEATHGYLSRDPGGRGLPPTQQIQPTSPIRRTNSVHHDQSHYEPRDQRPYPREDNTWTARSWPRPSNTPRSSESPSTPGAVDRTNTGRHEPPYRLESSRSSSFPTLSADGSPDGKVPARPSSTNEDSAVKQGTAAVFRRNNRPALFTSKPIVLKPANEEKRPALSRGHKGY